MRGVRRLSSIGLLALTVSCDFGMSPLPSNDPGATPRQEVQVDARVMLEMEVAREGDALVVQASTMSTATDPVILSYGYCSVVLRAYRRSHLGEPAYWDDHSDGTVGCPDIALEQTIPPGRFAFEITRRPEVALALGLPDGPGFFGVVLVLNGERVMIPGGPVERSPTTVK